MRPSELDAVPTAALLEAVRRRLEVVDAIEVDSKRELPGHDLEIYNRLQALVDVARAVAELLQAAVRDLDGTLVAELGRQHEIVARRHSELQRLYQVRLEVTRAALDRAAIRPELPQTSPSASQSAAVGRSGSSGGRNQAPV